jgi:AcrR family transcriptional regulator
MRSARYASDDGDSRHLTSSTLAHVGESACMTDDRARPAVSRKAEASAETRATLLEAGAALLREQPVGDVLSQVTARAVVERVGRTTGAFFHQWPTLEAYHRDLLVHVLDPARIPSTSEAIDAVLGGLHAGLDPATVLHLAARGNFESVQADPYAQLWQALWSKHSQDEQVHTLLRQSFDTVSGQVVPLLEACLAAAGRRMQPPFTVETFAVLITALVQGLHLRVAIEPETVPVKPLSEPPDAPGAQTSWDLFGTTVEILFRTITEPQDGGGSSPSSTART